MEKPILIVVRRILPDDFVLNRVGQITLRSFGLMDRMWLLLPDCAGNVRRSQFSPLSSDLLLKPAVLRIRVRVRVSILTPKTAGGCFGNSRWGSVQNIWEYNAYQEGILSFPLNFLDDTKKTGKSGAGLASRPLHPIGAERVGLMPGAFSRKSEELRTQYLFSFHFVLAFRVHFA